MEITRRIARVALLLNALLWLVAAAQIAATFVPYKPAPVQLETEYPEFVILWRMNPRGLLATDLLSVRVAVAASLPSAGIVYFVGHRSVETGHLLIGTSVGGYKLLAVAALSFGQWYLLSLLLGRAFRRLEAARHRSRHGLLRL